MTNKMSSRHLSHAAGRVQHQEYAPNADEQNTIVIENESLRQGFTLIPTEILKDKRVSFGARLTYTLLLSYAWQKGSCFPGQDTLAHDLGVTRKAVSAYLRELKECQYILWTRRGLGKTNVYFILDRASRQVSPAEAEKPAPEKSMKTDSLVDVTLRLHPDVTFGLPPDVTPQLQKTHTDETNSEQQQAVALKLQELKIDAKKIRGFLRRFSPEYLEGKMQLLAWRQHEQTRGRSIEDPTAWLIRAIEENYQASTGYMAWQARKKKRQEQVLQLKRWEDQNAKQRQQERIEENQKQRAGLQKLMKSYNTSAAEGNLWLRALDALEKQTDKSTYQFWFSDTRLLAVQNGIAVVSVPNMLAKQRIVRDYAP